MLMKKHATADVMEGLAGVVDEYGWTAQKACQSGVDNPDSSVGLYLGGPHSYSVFANLVNPIIEEYHGYDMSGHRSDFNLAGLPTDNLDPEGRFIVSTRIRVARNFAAYPFPSAISRESRTEMESKIISVLGTLHGDLQGEYHSLGNMSEAVRQQMVADHFLFKQGDRFLESAGVNRDWPEGRGIFSSRDKRFLVWVSEEDSMRIISMQEGGDLADVFQRLSRALDRVNQAIEFAFDPVLGYLTTCPTNIGTGMRASVHIKIPITSARQDFQSICSKLGLSIRGIDGEHSESKGGVYDISNKRRLGISERDIYAELYEGVKTLIEYESA
jgi:creatine kinase